MLICAKSVCENKSNSAVRVYAEWEMLRLPRMKRDSLRRWWRGKIAGDQRRPTLGAFFLNGNGRWKRFFNTVIDVNEIRKVYTECDVGGSDVCNRDVNLVA